MLANNEVLVAKIWVAALVVMANFFWFICVAIRADFIGALRDFFNMFVYLALVRL